DFGAAPGAILQALPHLDAVRRAFLAEAAAAEVEAPQAPAPIVVRPPETDIVEELPLTVVQRQHAFLARLDPAGSAAHNDLLAFDIEGDVDVDLLRRCLRALAERHESLRISFASDGERQRIHRTSDVDLGVIDLSARDDAEEAW